MSDITLHEILLGACRQLEQKGLVARTWGNMSVRIDDTSFLITPSGIPYEDLQRESLVKVRIEDIGWSATLKPSSEKGLHAMIYREKPEINAIIHTHQTWASAFAAARKPLHRTNGKTVPCAAYALPTTKALTQAVRKQIAFRDIDSVILANHGALFFAKHMDEAISLAVSVETDAKEFILKTHADKTGSDASMEALLDGFVRRYRGIGV